MRGIVMALNMLKLICPDRTATRALIFCWCSFVLQYLVYLSSPHQWSPVHQQVVLQTLILFQEEWLLYYSFWVLFAALHVGKKRYFCSVSCGGEATYYSHIVCILIEHHYAWTPFLQNATVTIAWLYSLLIQLNLILSSQKRGSPMIVLPYNMLV